MNDRTLPFSGRAHGLTKVFSFARKGVAPCFFALAGLAALAGCQRSGPPDKDVARLFTQEIVNSHAPIRELRDFFTGTPGKTPQVKIVQNDCTPHENGVFDCSVSFTVDQSKIRTVNGLFKKVAGTWMDVTPAR